MLNIEPIKLLSGCHKATGQTGQGCFLNVCSYLQGDTVITDKPSSVHGGLRKAFIILNDLAPNDEQRQRLVPLVHRAMLTGGKDDRSLVLGGTLIYQLAEESLQVNPFQFQRGVLAQREFDAGLKFLDALLPSDEMPSVEVAKRAADLALARAAWGDAPVPAEKSIYNEVSFFTSSFKQDTALEKTEQLIWEQLVALPSPPMVVGVNFKPHEWPVAIAPKSAYPKTNKPHGPIKTHKPVYY